MAVSLPLLTDAGATPHYSFSCTLEGAAYTFETQWNDRDDAWYLQIGDAEGNPLTGMTRVVLGKLLFKRYSDARLPPGFFVCVDTSGTNDDPGLADLGGRVQIWYYLSTDLG